MVIALSVMITITATGLFFATLVGNNRKDVVSAVKQEGDYAINQMAFGLRNAISIVPDPSFPTNPSCTTGMTRISFKSNSDVITTLYNDNGLIAAQPQGGTLIHYTSPAVTLVAQGSSPALVFNCSQTSTNYGTYITISFALNKQSTQYTAPANVTQQFSTSVDVRSLQVN